MRSIVTALVGLGACTASVHAAPRAHPQPTAAAVTTLDPIDVPAADPGGAADAGARAGQDAFNERIRRSSEQALRSVCVGCDSGSAPRARRRPRVPDAAGALPDDWSYADPPPATDPFE